MIEINHVVIKKIEEDNYVVNNTVTNKFVRLGKREVDYLLELLHKADYKEEEVEVPLSKQQKTVLYEKFEQWGFLKQEEKKKKKFDMSNIELCSFQSEGLICSVLNKLQIFISPLGISLFIASIIYVIYAFCCEGEAILAGLSGINFNIENMVFVYVITFVTSIIHELCHATACYKYSGRCGKIGIKLFYFLPAYFCDVSSIYMVADQKKAFIVSSAGLISNHIAGAIALWVYNVFYYKGITSSVLMLFYCYNLTSIILNLIPFAKFDGYWIMKSLIGIDNLYDKSILLFFDAIFSWKKFSSFKLNLGKKIVVAIYGGLVFLFHWLLWIYGGYSVYNIAEKYIFDYKYVVLIALIAFGYINCVKFTKRYIKLYKNH